jgi:hypothetical protein
MQKLNTTLLGAVNGTAAPSARRSGRSRLINLVGQQFGRWTVLALHPERVRYGKHTVQPLWLCRCTCGSERRVLGYVLRWGQSRSCGCLRREKSAARMFKHGHARRGKESRAYQRWQAMRQRCNNPRNLRYADYGGRGIGIRERWDSFVNYYADTGEAPEGKTLDRINNDDDYGPDN